MIEMVTAATLAEYEQFIQTSQKGHFLQSSRWGKVKSSWKWQGAGSALYPDVRRPRPCLRQPRPQNAGGADPRRGRAGGKISGLFADDGPGYLQRRQGIYRDYEGLGV